MVSFQERVSSGVWGKPAASSCLTAGPALPLRGGKEAPGGGRGGRLGGSPDPFSPPPGQPAPRWLWPTAALAQEPSGGPEQTYFGFHGNCRPQEAHCEPEDEAASVKGGDLSADHEQNRQGRGAAAGTGTWGRACTFVGAHTCTRAPPQPSPTQRPTLTNSDTCLHQIHRISHRPLLTLRKTDPCM